MLAASISAQSAVAAAPGRPSVAGSPQNAESPAAVFAFLFAAAGEALAAGTETQIGVGAESLPATPEGDSEIDANDALPGDRPKSRGGKLTAMSPLRPDPATLLNTMAVAPVAVPAATPEPLPAARALELAVETSPARAVELPEAADAQDAPALPASPGITVPLVAEAAPVDVASAGPTPAPKIAPALPQTAEPSSAPSPASSPAPASSATPSAEPSPAPIAAAQLPDAPVADDAPRVDRRRAETPVIQFMRAGRVPLEARSMPRVEAAPGSPAAEHPEAFSLRLTPAERGAAQEKTPAPLPATAPRAAAEPPETQAPKNPAAPEAPKTEAHTKPAAKPAGNSSAEDRDRRDRDDRGPAHSASDRGAAPEHPAAERPSAEVRPAAPQTNAQRAAAPEIASVAPKAEAPADPRPVKAPEAPSAPAPAQEVSDVKPAARPAQEIALRVGANSDSKVELRVSERAGEVYVSVRTPDSTLARAMRDDLGSLTGKLSQAGYETAAPTNDSSSFTRHQDRQQDAPGGRQDGSPSGGSGQQHQQRQQQEDGRGRRFPWMDSFAELLSDRQPEKEDQ